MFAVNLLAASQWHGLVKYLTDWAGQHPAFTVLLIVAVVLVVAWLVTAAMIFGANGICRVPHNRFADCMFVAFIWWLLSIVVSAVFVVVGPVVPPFVELLPAPLLLWWLLHTTFRTGMLRALFATVATYVISVGLMIVFVIGLSVLLNAPSKEMPKIYPEPWNKNEGRRRNIHARFSPSKDDEHRPTHTVQLWTRVDGPTCS